MVGNPHGNISFADGLAAAAMGRSLPGHNCQAAAEYAPAAFATSRAGHGCHWLFPFLVDRLSWADGRVSSSGFRETISIRNLSGNLSGPCGYSSTGDSRFLLFLHSSFLVVTVAWEPTAQSFFVAPRVTDRSSSSVALSNPVSPGRQPGLMPRPWPWPAAGLRAHP